MSATPIPRTLILTVYGDMDVSRLLKKPINRKEIITLRVPVMIVPGNFSKDHISQIT